MFVCGCLGYSQITTHTSSHIFLSLCVFSPFFNSANVLLDLSFRAKVGDFGLARPLVEKEDNRTSRVVGTSGYIPPEYYTGFITTKMDAFSFGVVSKVGYSWWGGGGGSFCTVNSVWRETTLSHTCARNGPIVRYATHACNCPVDR